jgi:hypothetical protein
LEVEMSNAEFNEAAFEKEKAVNDARWAEINGLMEKTIRDLESCALTMVEDHDKQRRRLQAANTREVERRRKAERKLAWLAEHRPAIFQTFDGEFLLVLTDGHIATGPTFELVLMAAMDGA